MDRMMLHSDAVSDNLHQLLKELMNCDELSSFYLVGGTALALRYGHRKSVDLDLFTHRPFNAQALGERLTRQFDLTEVALSTNTILGQINGIKCDFIAHQYQLVDAVETIDGMRLASVPDIAAMKLNAIANRGSKKDFWDYALLLQHFNRERLLSFFAQKYPNASLWNAEKSLAYFDDAEHDPVPLDLTWQTLEQVKEIISDSNRLNEA